MRLARVESLLKQHIATIIQQKVNNPKIGFISIVSVSVTKDISTAHVYYSQIGSEEDRKKTYFALKSSAKFIKGELGKLLHLKTTPNLIFKYDPSIERGSNIISKLNQLSA